MIEDYAIPRTDRDAENGVAGLDASAKFSTAIIPDAFVTTSTSAPGLGAGLSDYHLWIHRNGTSSDLYICPGLGANCLKTYATLPGWTQINPVEGDTFTPAAGGSPLSLDASDCVSTVGDAATKKVTFKMKCAGQAQGDIVYFNGDNWIRLGAGTSGQFLKTNGAGANPAWAAPSGGATINTLDVFRPQQNEPPASSFATLDTTNAHPVLVFVDASDTSAVFSSIMNRGYAEGNLTVDIHFITNGITTNAVGWCASFEALVAQDTDADGFATAQCTSQTVSGTDGGIAIASIAFTQAQADSIAAGGAYRLKITRDGDGTSVTDSATANAKLRFVEVRQ